MNFTNVYYAASGFGLNDCCFLGQHFLAKHGFHPDRAECWVIRATAAAEPGKTTFNVAYGVAGWFTGLWRSRSCAYVTELLGRIHICRDLDGIASPANWHRIDFKGMTMQGVWGLDDSNVFVWCKFGLEPRVLLWNGNSWSELPPPPGEIASMHGVAPDCVYAVGANALLSRWDGRNWGSIPLPTKEFLISIHVESEDEMYAVGHGAALWEGSSSGWGKVADGPGVLSGVTKFAGDIWVGGHTHGILKREKNKLIPIKPDIHAQVLDARDKLLIGSPEFISESSDGTTFVSKAKGLLARSRDDKTPLWGYESEEEEDSEQDDDAP